MCICVCVYNIFSRFVVNISAQVAPCRWRIADGGSGGNAYAGESLMRVLCKFRLQMQPSVGRLIGCCSSQRALHSWVQINMTDAGSLPKSFGMKVPHHGEVRLPNVKLAHWLTGQLADPIPCRRLRCVCTFRKRCRRIINCKLHSCNCNGNGDGDCLATCRQASQMRVHVCVRVGYTHTHTPYTCLDIYTPDYINRYTFKWNDTIIIDIFANDSERKVRLVTIFQAYY